MLRRICAAILLCFPATAKADWYEASSEHFVVYADQSPERLKRFATDLERFDKALRVLRNVPDRQSGNAQRVTVYTLPSVSAVERLSGQKNTAGFYDNRAGGSVAFIPRVAGSQDYELNAKQILLHEYVHHFMFANFSGAFPQWLVEGFAEFHATARFERDGGVTIGLPPQYRAGGLLTGNPLPVDRLLANDTDGLDDGEREALYGRGWLLIHYLTFQKARAGQLDRYLSAINEGKSPRDAATAFGDLKALGRELDRYLGTRFPAWRLEPGGLQIKPVALRKLSDGEAATMAVRIRSKRGVNRETAKDVLRDARRAAAPYPNDAGAQIALAEAEDDAGNYAECEAAADRALAVEPKSIDALIFKARAKFAAAVRASDTRPATWAAVHRAVVAANHVDPDDPRPLMLYYQSFLAAGLPPSESARTGLFRAFELTSDDDGLRLLVAHQLLRDHKVEDARATLRPLAAQTHADAMGQVARELMALLDAGRIDAALDKIVDGPGSTGHDKAGSAN